MLFSVLNTVPLESDEQDKFEKIYYKYRNTLFSCAISIVLNRHDAEDVLHTAFVKIAQNIKKIEDINSKQTASFLIIITKNTALDFLRTDHKNTQEVISEDIAYSKDLLEQLLEGLEYKKVLTVIKELKPPYNEVLYLHFVNDLSIKQTAKLLNRKEKTVKMQLVRGKKILISKLSEVPYE